MALIGKDHTFDSGHIISLPDHGLDVSLKCPTEFQLIASKLLTGWSFQAATRDEYDVSVVSDQKKQRCQQKIWSDWSAQRYYVDLQRIPKRDCL